MLEAVGGTAWRLYDIHRMNRFFEEARHHFLIREQPMSLYRQPVAFNRWFRRYAVGTPAISILALHSGVCGDQMRLLNLSEGRDIQLPPKTVKDIRDTHKDR